MKIIIKDPNGYDVLTLQFNLLDTNINRGRHIIVRSCATKYGFLTGTSIRKDAQGISYIELKMKPTTESKKVSLLTRALTNALI